MNSATAPITSRVDLGRFLYAIADLTLNNPFMLRVDPITTFQYYRYAGTVKCNDEQIEVELEGDGRNIDITRKFAADHSDIVVRYGCYELAGIVDDTFWGRTDEEESYP